MSRKSLPVVLSEPEITRLEQWLRAGSTPQQVVLRAKIILRASQGQSDQQIARDLKLQRQDCVLCGSKPASGTQASSWPIAGIQFKAFENETDASGRASLLNTMPDARWSNGRHRCFQVLNEMSRISALGI